MPRLLMLALLVCGTVLCVDRAEAASRSRSSCPNGQCSQVTTYETSSTVATTEAPAVSSHRSSATQCSGGQCSKSYRTTAYRGRLRWFRR